MLKHISLLSDFSRTGFCSLFLKHKTSYGNRNSGECFRVAKFRAKRLRHFSNIKMLAKRNIPCTQYLYVSQAVVMFTHD